MKKPKQLLLPPEYIYSNEFHEMVSRHNNESEIFNDKHAHLWFCLIAKTCRYKIRLIQDIKGFCQSLYGICRYGYLLPTYLFLDGAPDLPHHFFEKSYIDNLTEKYNPIEEYWLWDKRGLNFCGYILISSRKTVLGE